MPSSGARSGTKPKRPTRGGRGDVGPTRLACGHDVDHLDPVAKYPGGKTLYRCGICQTMQARVRR